MRSENLRAITFPAKCKRCGADVSEPVSFCPFCGAHARFAFGSGELPRAAQPQVGRSMPSVGRPMPRDEPVWSSRPTPLFATPADAGFGTGGRQPFYEGSGRRWGIKAGTAIVLAAFVVGVGAFVLANRHDKRDNTVLQAQDAMTQRVDGIVRADDGSPSSSAVPSALSAAPAVPPATRPDATAKSSGLPNVDSRGAGERDGGHLTSHDPLSPADGAPASARPVPPAQTQTAQTASRGGSDQRAASVVRALAAARASLAKSNLTAASKALATVRSMQPGDSRASILQQDLASREKVRDDALSQARSCAIQQRWNCAWHYAGDALSLDSGSAEAKGLVQRAMIESGAAFRPAGPGPDGPYGPVMAQ